MYYLCYIYIFLFLCMFRSRYCVSLCFLYIVFVSMCTVLLPPGVNPVAVNKYNKYFEGTELIYIC
jgi:hypothetical protein